MNRVLILGPWPREGSPSAATFVSTRSRRSIGGLAIVQVCLCACLWASWSGSARQVHTLADHWRFQIDAADLGEKDGWYQLGYDRSGWSGVTVPRAWDLYETALWGYEGLGWYSLELPAAMAKPDLVQRLRFERVNYHTKVWLNGEFLGENVDGWMPFEFDVTGRLRSNQVNHLVLRVDNRPRPNWLPGGTRIEWVQYGGLIGSVYLDDLAPTYISDLTILSVTPRIECAVSITSRLEETVLLELQVENERCRTNLFVRPNGLTKAILSFTLSEPQWWSPDTPHLYNMKAELSVEGRLLDRVTERFGLRHVSVAGRQILLNGSPIQIRGVNRYDEYAPYGPTPPRDLVIEDLHRMRRAGVNTVRVHYPQSPELIALYDELGFLMIEELPINWWQLHPSGADSAPNDILEAALATLERMIGRDKNHPSIVIWSMANESPTDTPLGTRTMHALIRRARELDQSRLVTFVASHGDLGRHRAFAEADLVGANVYAGTLNPPIAQHRAEIQDKVYRATLEYLHRSLAAFPDKPLLITEFGTKGIRGLRGNALFTEDFQADCIRAAWNAIRETKETAGGVLWCWADYYHRRDFIEYAPFGPYGVVSVDRKPKLALEVLRELYSER